MTISTTFFADTASACRAGTVPRPERRSDPVLFVGGVDVVVLRQEVVILAHVPLGISRANGPKQESRGQL